MDIGSRLSGWKLVLAWVLANLPLFTEHPLLIDAIEKVTNDPSWMNIGNFLVNVLFVVGVADRVRKNVTNEGRN